MNKINNFNILNYNNVNEIELPFINNLNSNYIPLNRLSLNEIELNNSKYYLNNLLDTINDINMNNYNNYLKRIDIIQSGYKLLFLPLSDVTYRYDTAYYCRSSSSSYLKLFNNEIVQTILNDKRLIMSNGCLFYNNNNILTPLFITVVNKEHIRYIRQCMIMKKEIHPKAIKILVNSEFDKPRGILPVIRKYYNRYFKKKFIKAGVEIIKVDNFDIIYSKLEIPKPKNIDEHFSILDNLSKDFLNNKHLEINNITF